MSKNRYGKIAIYYTQTIRPYLWIPSITAFFLGEWYSSMSFPFFETLIGLFSNIIIISSIYTINFVFDRDLDKSAGREFKIFNFLTQRQIFLTSLIIALFGLLLLSTINLSALVIGVLGLILGIFYSAPPIRFKCRPPFDCIAHILGYGVISFCLGWSINMGITISAIFIGILIGLLISSGQVFFTVFDIEIDRNFGIKTIATKLDVKYSIYLGFLLYGLSLLLSLIILTNSIFTISLIICLPLVVMNLIPSIHSNFHIYSILNNVTYLTWYYFILIALWILGQSSIIMVVFILSLTIIPYIIIGKKYYH